MADPFDTTVKLEDEDPAADFLAREQQELAGLEDDGFVTLDSTAAVENVEDVKENPTDSEDGLDLLGGSVLTSIQTPPQDDLFGVSAFVSQGQNDVPADMTAPVDSVSCVELAPSPVPEADFPIDAITTKETEKIPSDTYNPAGSEDGLDFFGGSVLTSTQALPPQEDLFDADDFVSQGQNGGATELDLEAPIDAASDLAFAPSPATDEPVKVPSDAYVSGGGITADNESAPQTQKILKWREDQLEKISEKDKNEELKKEEWRSTAKRELEEWYSRQAEQVEKHKKNNRVSEAEFIKERDETTPGNEWERISRLCDFNPKNNKNTKDISRLRSILLQLKQNPLQRS